MTEQDVVDVFWDGFALNQIIEVSWLETLTHHLVLDCCKPVHRGIIEGED